MSQDAPGKDEPAGTPAEAEGSVAASGESARSRVSRPSPRMVAAARSTASPLAVIRRYGRERRMRRTMATLEWAAALILIGVGLYFLWFLVFPTAEPEPGDRRYTREDFRLRLRELPAARENADWTVRNQSPRWRRIVIHHTATESGTVEAFDRNHREERKWENGLGYHFVIGNGKGMADGEVAVGGRWREQLDGAHVVSEAEKKLNETSIGVALVGNFETGLPTARQLASLKALLNFLRRECNIGLASIVGHRDLANTACPGANIYLDEVLLVLANS